MAKAYPTLAQVANKFTSLAVAAAPRRKVNGGNLKTQLAAYNRPAGMIKAGKNGRGYSLTLDVSPPNARYGKFWNDPNVSWQVRNQKTGNNASINFAITALNSSDLAGIINEYNAGIINESVGMMIQNTLGKGFQKLSSIK